MANDVATVQSSTTLGGWTNWALMEVSTDFSTALLEMDDYQKKCVQDAMSAIFQLVVNDPKADLNRIDKSNLRDILKNCASLKLSATNYPKEVYFQLRNKKVGDNWVQQVEMGIEGDGYDALLRNFGVDVKTVHNVWIVYEGDDFTFPKHRGLEVEPPLWEPKGLSTKAIRVVYPVEMKSGYVEYLIAEREGVKGNLSAHIRNNLMNETFGICENRFKASKEQLAQIKARKDEIFNALSQCQTLDAMLACPEARPFMSPSWLESTESMIIRKMRNNATRRVPKNYNTIQSQSILQLDDVYKSSKVEIEENENSTPFLIEQN